MTDLAKPDFSVPRGSSELDPTEYRSVSGLAVIALIVAALGATVLVEPFAWVLAAAGMIMGIVAWVRIARSEGALIGWKVAFAALVVSGIFLVAAPVEAWRYRVQVEAEATEFVERWFDVLREHDGEMAYLLTQQPQYRRRMVETGDPSIDDRYQASVEAYLGQPSIKKLLSWGDRARPQCEGTIGYDRQADADYVGLRYRIDDAGPNPEPSFDVAIALQRMRRPSGKDAPFGQLGRASWVIVKAGEPVEKDEHDEHDESEHGK